MIQTRKSLLLPRRTLGQCNQNPSLLVLFIYRIWCDSLLVKLIDYFFRLSSKPSSIESNVDFISFFTCNYRQCISLKEYRANNFDKKLASGLVPKQHGVSYRACSDYLWIQKPTLNSNTLFAECRSWKYFILLTKVKWLLYELYVPFIYSHLTFNEFINCC